jgi:hypothetical protein
MQPDWLPSVIILALVGIAVWYALQPRCAFVVQIVAGNPQASKGAVTPAFLEQIRDLCTEHGIQHGVVRGIIRGARIALAFSRDFPPSAQQQLRNWWGLSGWPAPRRRG